MPPRSTTRTTISAIRCVTSITAIAAGAISGWSNCGANPPARPQRARPPYFTSIAIFSDCTGGFGLGLGIGTWLDTAPRSAIAAEPWVETVADYQALHSRATVNQTDANGVDPHRTAARLAPVSVVRSRFRIYARTGLAFKRGQPLEFAGQPLVQWVYLPTQGKPIAYCLLRTGATDLAPTPGMAHLLIGDVTAAEIEKLAAAARAS